MPKKKELYTATYTFDGKRYYIRSAKSQRDADKKAATALSEREAGRMILSRNTLVRDYTQVWLETYKKNSVSTEVYKRYNRFVDELNTCYGALRISDVRPTQLQRVINSHTGKSADYLEKLRYTIQQIFRQARLDHLIADDPALQLSVPIGSANSHRSITEMERAAILQAAETHRFGLPVLLMLYCGLRPQEVAALRFSDIDQVNHRLRIRHALKASGGEGDTKSKAGNRDIPVPDVLWSILHPMIPDDASGYVCTAARGGRYSHTSMRQGWKYFLHAVDVALGAELLCGEDGTSITRQRGEPIIVRSALADDLTMYCLRHTYCTDLEASGVPINVARYLMGHSSIELTARIYTHMRDDILDSISEKIGATVGATLNPQKRAETCISIAK